MTDFLLIGLAIGLTVLVYGVVVLLVAAFQEHVNNMENGHGHIGGIALDQSARNLWADRCRRVVSQVGQRIRSTLEAKRAQSRTVYLDQLYADNHPRIHALKKVVCR